MSNGKYNGYTWRWYDEPGLRDEGEGELVHVCTFPDTGLRRSWCSGCGAPAEFDAETGTYRKAVASNHN